jgi:hypothetical protein
MRSLKFFYLPNPYSRTMAQKLTQSLTEMSAGNEKEVFLGSRVRQARKADNFTANCEA